MKNMRRLKWLMLFVVVGSPVLSSFVFAGSIAKADSVNTYDPSVCSSAASGSASQDCLDMIQAFPRPNVTPIKQDAQTLDSYSFWKIGPDATDTYDQPTGPVTGSIPKGYNFVSAIDLSVNGWIQIQGGKWIQTTKAKLSKPSFYTGVTLPDGLDYPFAWVLDKSGIYTSLTPGGPGSKETKRNLVRYERVNLYATAKDKDGMDWYMIGPNQWVKQTFLGVVHKTAPPAGVSGFWVAVDLYEQTMVAYQGTTPVFATLVASGLPGHDTHQGLFKVWARVTQDNMSGATGAPSAYALQHVPWVMYFDDGISLHGTYWHDLFGYRQSHGCVNLSISDAKYMFDWMQSIPPQNGTPSTPAVKPLKQVPSEQITPTATVTDVNAIQYDENGQPLIYVNVYASGEYGNGVIRQ